MIRVVHHALLFIAVGMLAPAALIPHQLAAIAIARLRNLALLALLVSLLAGSASLLEHGEMLVPGESMEAAFNAALSTWIGKVIAAQCLLSVAALAFCRSRKLEWLALLLSVLAASSAALRGHIIAGGELGALGIAAAIHIAIAMFWIGGLVALVVCQQSDARGELALPWRSILRSFSGWALPAMLILLFTGVILAFRTVGSGAALIATPYGQALLAKLALIVVALWCALRLRGWLVQAAATTYAHAVRWLRAELLLALAILGMAGVIASTIPGAHDGIDWPLNFRIAPVAAFLQRGADVIWAGGAAAAALVASLIGAALLWHRSIWRSTAVAMTGLLAAFALAVPALSVDAYPTTYHHSPVPYDATSVVAGARLYRQWCVGCHGLHGRGDGPLAEGLAKRPANLTEPHVQWHTHGDIYWWLSSGMPQSGMPGFSDRLSVDERWHLLNFLSALSLGVEARPMSTAVAPRDPWLPAIDFRYLLASGEMTSLSEWRREQRPVLLAFAGNGELDSRAAALSPPAIPADLVRIAVLPAHMPLSRAPLGWDTVTDVHGDIMLAWSFYRRTLEDPDFSNERVQVAGMLFLIDRFGFIRARWTAATGWPDPSELGVRLADLAAEPEIRSADLHAPR